MAKKRTIFNDAMTSRQIAIKYFSICDSVKGDERKQLDNQFDNAYKKAQTRELEYAFGQSEDGTAYVAR